MKKYLLFILILFSITGGATNNNVEKVSDSTFVSFDIGLLGLLGLLSFAIIPISRLLKKSEMVNDIQVQESISNCESPKFSRFDAKISELENQINLLKKQQQSLVVEVEDKIHYFEKQRDHQMDQMHKYINDSKTKNGIIVPEPTSEIVITNADQVSKPRVYDHFYIGTPSENKPISIMNKEFNQRDHYYEIKINSLEPMNASFRISSLANINRMMGQPDNYITPACECNSTNFETGKKIQTIKDGKLHKRANEWFLVEKSIIQII